MGKAEGIYEEEAAKIYGSEIFAPFEVTLRETYEASICNQESRKQSLERFVAAIDFIKSDCRCERAGVACHGMVMQYYYYHLYDVRRQFANCDYFVVEV